MLSQLREIVEKVSRVEDVHQALNTLVRETCTALSTECCTIYLANEERQRLELMATQGLTFHGDSIHIQFEEGLVGLVKRSAEPLNLAEASKHPAFKYFPQLGEETYHSFLGAPIIHRKKVLGVLVIQQKTPRLFSEMEESFLVTLSAQLAVIIAHAQSLGHWSLASKPAAVQGIAASSGVAIGEFWYDNSQPILSEVCPASTLDKEREQEWLAVAIEAALADFRRMRKKFDSEINKDALAIFDLFTHLLNDPMLRTDLKKHVERGDRADWALRQVVESYSSRFARMSDVYLRERAHDIRELGQRLLFFLHNSEQEQPRIERPVILVANELTASLLASVPKKYLLAVVALEGAANSHAAILSRALGVPAVMGANLNLEEVHGKQGIVDGYSGEIYIQPNRQILREYRSLVTEESELFAMVNKELALPAKTQDDVDVEVLLNAGLSADSNIAINAGVDGVGLYRTEIAFLLQHRFPSEDEQYQQYRAILSSYPQQRVVMRTLDIGGDKPLPYLPIEEDNPFLGWRGIRFTLDHPDIFLIQLRAMLRASAEHGNLSILLPMISGVGELDDAIRLIQQAYHEVVLLDERVVMPQIGVMIEVPSMVYLIPSIAQRVDFVSVGTNDLTQYLLAVDRNNARVSDVYESLHPAVLQALQQIYQQCGQYHLPVCICGELAGDPFGALLLLGLGYRSLSMNTSNVARIKYLIRHSQLSDLQALSQQALSLSYGKDIHQLMRDYFINHDFAGFIRAGKK
ncbi:phosphoenolpyruvate--protein phosphotransferase [Vibrio vulnificus]|uniref:phosphoenolpyruvate--protein phosphotransferase n=1 Tax=Vibrio vulnificus TaxID=672 RepID=UPI0004F5A16A|nr:phosphoenolpyruvate--protein phosphotransferase [Vibrio vulnificus]AIL69713.1 fused phosphoenolpyruvate-protein phosphotransferase PtsP/GAF domain [Vibrio vulnificus]EGR0110624.1 phosphoenolpyruvate--protein phosphotransferase [Vibrio vulnificus]EIF5017623.1 phosphoenolpyruvate--protein phosphotransferase [Vibrio vulnificus]EIO2321529.1 phosphoenolpyruvate--protein phosphotransferase [Vibrio vulnificus]EIO4069826.1 phosphoenolpyruvate--protein phosphotransferase [Vibrio vulnificus]